MTLSTVYLGIYGVLVYSGQAGGMVSAVSLNKPSKPGSELAEKPSLAK